MLSKVFVYGTLKPGLRYHGVARRGGKFTAEEAFIEGFDLYHLSPENYPAIKEGMGRVHGWCFTYDDIDFAMPFLDELEGVDSDPPDYKRIQTRLYLKNNTSSSTEETAGTSEIGIETGMESSPPLMTWVYVFQDHDTRCQQTEATSSSTFLPDGIWLPCDNENGSLMRVEMETQHLLVIKNQPIMAMDTAVESVRAFLTSTSTPGSLLKAEELGQALRVVTQFSSSTLLSDEQQQHQQQENEMGVIIPPHVYSAVQTSVQQHQQQHQQQQLQQSSTGTSTSAEPLFSISTLQAGSYLQYTYRGPYYGLTEAWKDFSAAVTSPECIFEAVEGAEYFQIFANYNENTLAADLRTDLYIRVKQ